MKKSDLIPLDGTEIINPLKLLIEALSKQVGDFLGKIVGPPAEALGGMLGDQMRSFRAANLERIARKWTRVRKERGISEATIKVLPFGDAYRSLEAASLEESDSVQELWAHLIAGATDSSRSVTIKKAFIDLLKSLGTTDAILLDIFFDYNSSVPAMIFDKKDRLMLNKFIDRTIKKAEHLKPEDLRSSIQNLLRLRIIGQVIYFKTVFGDFDDKTTPLDHIRKFSPDQTANALIKLYEHMSDLSESSLFLDETLDEMSSSDLALHSIELYRLTALGFDLLQACTDS